METSYQRGSATAVHPIKIRNLLNQNNLLCCKICTSCAKLGSNPINPISFVVNKDLEPILRSRLVYNASAVKLYQATSSLVRFEKNYH
jgi:hypothetical protein